MDRGENMSRQERADAIVGHLMSHMITTYHRMNVYAKDMIDAAMEDCAKIADKYGSNLVAEEIRKRM